MLTGVPHGGYDFISGRSFAAAHVSGVVALLLEMHPGMPASAALLLDSSQDFQHSVPAGERADGAPRRGIRAASAKSTCALMTHLGRSAACADAAARRLPCIPPAREQAS